LENKNLLDHKKTTKFGIDKGYSQKREMLKFIDKKNNFDVKMEKEMKN